ncbi:hypothetical protein D3C84_1195260 [compost metagenome]
MLFVSAAAVASVPVEAPAFVFLSFVFEAELPFAPQACSHAVAMISTAIKASLTGPRNPFCLSLSIKQTPLGS